MCIRDSGSPGRLVVVLGSELRPFCRFEVAVEHPVLKAGALDVQQTAAVQAVKFVRRLGALNTEQMRTVKQAVAQMLGLKLASEGPQPMP